MKLHESNSSGALGPLHSRAWTCPTGMKLLVLCHCFQRSSAFLLLAYPGSPSPHPTGQVWQSQRIAKIYCESSAWGAGKQAWVSALQLAWRYWADVKLASGSMESWTSAAPQSCERSWSAAEAANLHWAQGCHSHTAIISLFSGHIWEHCKHPQNVYRTEGLTRVQQKQNLIVDEGYSELFGSFPSFLFIFIFPRKLQLLLLVTFIILLFHPIITKSHCLFHFHYIAEFLKTIFKTEVSCLYSPHFVRLHYLLL